MGIDPLIESTKTIKSVLESFEYAGYYLNQEPFGEPMMSKRDLYRAVNNPSDWFSDDDEESGEESISESELFNRMMIILQYSDGNHSALEIAERYGVSVGELAPAIDQLCETDLLEPDIRTPEYKTYFDISSPHK
jgi:aminopeptidase-like protein